MRSTVFIGFVSLLMLSTSCLNPGDNLTSPVIPDLQNKGNNIDSPVWECRANMRALASACVIYFVSHETYPVNLSALGEPYSLMTCPECSLPYELKGNENSCSVICPMPFESCHGYITNGVSSWFSEGGCQSNMTEIADETVVFFADNGRYPYDLEEIGMENLQCPVCATPYVYILSSFEEGVFIGCPLPPYSNHGFILNGSASWLPEQTLEHNCHENMRTIASQAVIFYAMNDRYPYDLEEMGMEYVVCRSCEASYIYYIYEGSSGYPACYIECPLQIDPNHGNIDDGVASWYYSRTTTMPE